MKKHLQNINPFRYGCVVEDSFYCPRPSLERQLAGFIRSGQNVVVHGERRMGKTSLINAVVRGMRGWRMLYVDLLHVQTVGDVREEGSDQTLRTQICLFVQRRVPFFQYVLSSLASAS